MVRVEGGRILAVLAATTGDLQLAEDAVQDAAVAALEVWPRTGRRPIRRRGCTWPLDARRSTSVRRESTSWGKEAAASDLVGLLAADPPGPGRLRDDTLRLLFTCCHPALSTRRQGGPRPAHAVRPATDEVARVLLVAEPTMAKRLVRAKQKIATAQDPVSHPGRGRAARPPRRRRRGRPPRLHRRPHGAAGGGGAPRAVRRGRAPRPVAGRDAPGGPDDRCAAGAAAADGRQAAGAARRPTASWCTLAEQDRRRWRRSDIDEGMAALNRSLTATDGRADSYQLQAAIAACHAGRRPTTPPIGAEMLRLYELLAALGPNPAVELNAAVAAGEVDGPCAGLTRLDRIAERDRDHLWHLARAELLVRDDRPDEARHDFSARSPTRPAPPNAATSAAASPPSPPEPDLPIRGFPASEGLQREAPHQPSHAAIPRWVRAGQRVAAARSSKEAAGVRRRRRRGRGSSPGRR